MRESETLRGWEGALERWLAPFLSALGREAQRRWAPVYLKGLILPGERKSVEPLAARVAPGGTEQLHHFIGGSPWATGPLEAVLAEEADALVGGPEAVLGIDDPALPRRGKHWVGVARQYCGCLGKRANCQVLVSLPLARGEVPVPVGLRLFLPDEWTADPGRCARAGVPEEHRRALAKPEIALEEVDRVIAAGVRFGRVLADAGYGAGAAFRRGLSARGLLWAVGVLKVQNVYPAAVGPLWPTAAGGRPRKHPVPSEAPVAAEAALAGVAWRRVSWRRGTKGPLAAEFAALRVRPAEGEQLRNGRHPPGEGWERSSQRAGRRASRLGRAEVLPLEPAGGRDARGAGGPDQGPLGVRAGAPAAQGGAGARPLRGPLLDRPAPARAHGDARLLLPPAPAAEGTGEKAKPDRRGRRRGRACPRSAGGCSRPSTSRSPAARAAGLTSGHCCRPECPGSARWWTLRCPDRCCVGAGIAAGAPKRSARFAGRQERPACRWRRWRGRAMALCQAAPSQVLEQHR